MIVKTNQSAKIRIHGYFTIRGRWQHRSFACSREFLSYLTRYTVVVSSDEKSRRVLAFERAMCEIRTYKTANAHRRALVSARQLIPSAVNEIMNGTVDFVVLGHKTPRTSPETRDGRHFARRLFRDFHYATHNLTSACSLMRRVSSHRGRAR